MTRYRSPVSVSFAGHELHSPRFELDAARGLARERFGVDGAVSELGSHQDQNALIDTAAGRYVLKIANAAFGVAELDLQNRAMQHLGARLELEIPQPCASLDGSEIVAVERDGTTYLVRLVTYVEGEPLLAAAHLAPAVLRALGEAAGRVARALEDFEHPGSRSRHAVGSAARRRRRGSPCAARRGSAPARARRPHGGVRRRTAIERLLPQLRRQIIHCDVTDWNVIGRRDRAGLLMPCGVIDFGDVTRTPRVCELAVAASIAYGHDPDEPIAAAAEIVRGFDSVCPLDDAELEALPHLIAARAAIVAVGTEQQALLEPHNAYAQSVRAGDWAICEAAAAVSTRLAEAAFRLACGRSAAGLAPRVPSGVWPLPGVVPGAAVDLSPGSDALADGAWRSPAALAALAPPGSIGEHGEARLPATRELANAEPATIHLGLDLFAPAGSEVRAPVAGRVERVGERDLVLGAGRCGAPGRARPIRRCRRGSRRGRRGRARRRGRSAAVPPARAGRRPGPGCPAGPRGAVARRRLARALPASGADARARVAGAPGEDVARAPPGGHPARAAALLRPTARDGARLRPAPLRRRRARLARLRQQRRARRSQPSARGRGGRAPAAPAEHQLALPLRGR